MGKILALDFGTKRIGVAMTDETKTIAFAKPYILNTEKEKLIELIKENEVEKILLGLPIGLSSQETESTKKVREFAAWLQEKASLSIELIDERLTTQEVRRFETNKELVDSLVAQKMLEAFIAKLKI